MKKFLILSLLFAVQHLSAQTVIDYELGVFDSLKKPFAPYKHQFMVLTDSNYAFTKNKLHYSVLPELLVSSEPKKFSLLGDIHVNTYVHLSNKMQFYASARIGYTNTGNTAYASPLESSAYFQQKLNNKDRLFQDVRARFIYTPNRFISIHTGLDKHFIGQGDRSLLLGDQGMASPFVLFEAKLWKFSYLNIQEIRREGQIGHYVPKGSSTHFLNFQHKQFLSIGIFETVTHLIKDTLYNRGFDVEYLNPLIFYRPQEYSLGSSDNVILGIDGHIKFGKSVLYGQVILDEFLLAQIRARNRWWANKYGFQIGYKHGASEGDRSHLFRTEFSLMRPYTFSHLNSSLNYGNQGMPVSHPLGSNFIEIYSELTIRRGRISNQTWFQLYVKGDDPEGDSITYSYGGDLYQSYINRPENSEFGVYIGRGTHTVTWQLGNRSNYTFYKDLLQFFVEPRLFIVQTPQRLKTQLWFTMGLQTCFAVKKRNY